MIPSKVLMVWFRLRVNRLEKKTGPKVLVLDQGRFRDDLPGMAEYSQMEIYPCPREVQDRFSRVVHYLNPGIDDLESNGMDIRFLVRFIRALKAELGISAIMSAAVFYRRNILWEKACREAGLLFVCLHRESAAEDPEVLERLVAEGKLDLVREFYGHHIFAGSEHFKKALIDSNYIEEDRVTVTGLPRFDISYHRRTEIDELDSKHVVLFSFMPAFSVPEVYEIHGVHIEAGFVELFSSVHRVMARLALKNEQAKFVIKPKWYSGIWRELIDKAVEDEIGSLEKWPPNFSVTDTESAQELIGKSGLAIAFNSTTIIETLLQERLVVVPWYAEAAGRYQHNVFYQNYQEAFLVAKSENELEDYLHRYLRGTLVDDTRPERFLSDVCGPYDGKSSQRIEHAILSLEGCREG